MRSKRQWRFAFASGQPWARRWARETGPFSALPEAKAETDNAGNRAGGPAGRPMTPKERAQHAALVRWGKKNPLMARQLALREKRKVAAAAKPKADPAAEAAQARAETFSALDLPEDAVGALEDLRNGVATDDDGGLVKMGLAEQASDGSYRLTAAGRQVYAAASRGDVGAARDALSAARDRRGAADARQADREKAKAEKEKAAAEKKPKGGKGGGGGGGKDKPKEEAKPDPKAEAAGEALRAAGLKPADLDDLRAAAESGGVESPRLRALGLVGEDGQTTDQGRRALRALERGDVRGYRAALQDVEAARGRERGRQEARDAADRQRAERDRAAADARARAGAEAAAEDEALLADFEAGRQGLTMAQQRRLKRAGLIEYDERGRIRRAKVEVKHGAHDQSSHGRRTGRRAAYQGAYRAARNGGASPAEARAKGREASAAYRGDGGSQNAQGASSQGVTQREWRRRYNAAERDVQSAMSDFAQASTAAGAVGLKPAERRARQNAADAAEQRLREAQARIREVSATPVVAAAPKAPSQLSQIRARLREAEALQRQFWEASAAAGEPGLSPAERRRRQREADRIEQQLRDASARARQASGSSFG